MDVRHLVRVHDRHRHRSPLAVRARLTKSVPRRRHAGGGRPLLAASYGEPRSFVVLILVAVVLSPSASSQANG